MAQWLLDCPIKPGNDRNWVDAFPTYTTIASARRRTLSRSDARSR
jgi:hypothetical protein